MSRKKFIDVVKILERAKIALEVTKDSELCNILDIKSSTIANWKKRGSIDLDKILSFCEHVSADWLIHGKGDMEGANDIITQKIFKMMEDMTEDEKRDVLKYIEKEKLLKDLLDRQKTG